MHFSSVIFRFQIMLIRAVVTLISFAGCFCFPERTKWTNEEIDFVDGTKRFFHAVLENQTEVSLLATSSIYLSIFISIHTIFKCE